MLSPASSRCARGICGIGDWMSLRIHLPLALDMSYEGASLDMFPWDWSIFQKSTPTRQAFSAFLILYALFCPSAMPSSLFSQILFSQILFLHDPLWSSKSYAGTLTYSDCSLPLISQCHQWLAINIYWIFICTWFHWYFQCCQFILISLFKCSQKFDYVAFF